MERFKILKRTAEALAVTSLLACAEPPTTSDGGSETYGDPYKGERITEECQACSQSECVDEVGECNVDSKCSDVADCVTLWESFTLEQCKDIAIGNEAWLNVITCVRDNCSEVCEEAEPLFPKY